MMLSKNIFIMKSMAYIPIRKRDAYICAIFLFFPIFIFAQESNDSTKVIEIPEVLVLSQKMKQTSRGYSIILKGEDIVKGKMTNEVLDFLPGVTKINGQYLLEGETVRVIYVNGQRIHSLQELQNIPGERLLKAEIEYMSSMGERTTGNGGTIRLTIEKPSQGGYYGSATAGWGSTFKYGWRNLSLGGFSYYGLEKLVIYENLGIAKNRYFDDEYDMYQYLDTSKEESRKTLARTKKTSIFNRVSLSYDINSRHNLGANFSFNAANTPSKTRQQQWQEDAWQGLPPLFNKVRNLQTQTTLQYYGHFNGDAHWLFTTLDYLHSYYKNDATYIDDYTCHSRSYNLLQLRAEYNTPLAHRIWLTVGTRSTLFWLGYKPTGTSEGWLAYRQGNASGKGKIPTAFVSIQRRRERWTWNLGLRWKHNAIVYTNNETRISSKNIENSLNPEFILIWLFDQKHKHQLRFTAKHELYNVPYYAINSSLIWRGNSHYTTGNPYLRANKDYVMQLNTSLYSSKWIFSVRYAYDYDMIHFVNTVSEAHPNDVITRPENARGHQQTISISGGYNGNITKWWRTNNNVRFRWTKENATLAGIRYNRWNHRMAFFSNNNFTFTKSMGATLNGHLEPTFTFLATRMHWVTQVRASLYRNFGSHITISLNGTVFRHQRKADFCSSNLLRHSANRSSEYGINVNFTYQFNGRKKVAQKVINTQQQFQEMNAPVP